MSYKGHIIGGIIAYLVLLVGTSCVYTITPLCAFMWFFVCLFGALFPDLDTKSKIRTFFLRISLGLFLVLLALPTHRVMILPLLPFIVIPLISRHRGLFHSKLFLIVLPAFLVITLTLATHQTHPELIVLPTLFFITGACSHLILDGKI